MYTLVKKPTGAREEGLARIHPASSASARVLT